MLSRRGFCGWIGAVFAFGCGKRQAVAAPPYGLGLPGSLAAASLRTIRSARREYRADAVVTFLGIPVFARNGVGTGFAEVLEASSGDTRIVSIQFGGRSNPQAAHGLSCLGFIQDAAAENRSEGFEAATFGFLNARGDESYEQARHAVLSRSGNESNYVAVEGRHQSGHARYEKAYLSVPGGESKQLPDLAECIRSRFPGLERKVDELDLPNGSTTTFLHTIRAGVKSGCNRYQADYIHNAKLFHLELERSADREVPLVRYTGKVLDRSTHKTSTFRFWMDDASELPCRIEYHPRSYLKIQFEYEASLVRARDTAGRTHETITTPLAVAK